MITCYNFLEYVMILNKVMYFYNEPVQREAPLESVKEVFEKKVKETRKPWITREVLNLMNNARNYKIFGDEEEKLKECPKKWS